MNTTLKMTIETICKERDMGWDAAHDWVDKLMEEYGESNFAAKVFDNVPRSIPFEIIADIFNMGIWSGNNNGRDIINTTNDWLKACNDTRKMLVALNLEVLPYKNKEEAIQALKEVPDDMWIVRIHIQRAIDRWEKT